LDAYPVSVCVPTRLGWPRMRLSIDAVLPQVRAEGGQLVVADASGLAAPEWSDAEDVTWISMPGAPGYALRQAAYHAVSAPLTAIIEDHVAPAPGWLRLIQEEHAAHPDAAVIYGVVDNGSREHAVDWALFGVGYLAWAPPTPAVKGSPGHANLSFKTRIFEQHPPEGDEVLEFRYVDALRSAGIPVRTSDRLRVTHFQSSGLRHTASLFFHNGRAIAGLRRQRMGVRDWIRTLMPLAIAGFRTARTLALARTKPQMEPMIRRVILHIALLHTLHAVGESVGYLAGPGDSATKLH
jgi:hypothetical protein